jgi:hypothetical protein
MLKQILYISIFCLLVNCVGSKSASSSSFISLAGLISNNPKSNLGSNPVGAVSVPPYGNTASGATYTNTGVPSTYIEKIELSLGYQFNLNLFDLLGIFYHQDRNFPEMKRITDLSIVKLDSSLEKPEQKDWHFNQFFLDASAGMIVFTKGLNRIGYYKNALLINAKKIQALKNGKIGIIDASSNLSICHAFNGESIDSDTACHVVATNVKGFSNHMQNNILYFDINNSFFTVNSINKEITPLDFRKNLLEVIYVNVNENIVTIIHDNGYSITAFLDSEANSNSRFEEKASTKNITTFSYLTGSEEKIENNKINSIVRSMEGRFYAFSKDLGTISIFNPNLEAYNNDMQFPYILKPFRRIKSAVGIQMHPNSRLIHVFDEFIVQIVSEVNIFERVDLSAAMPTQILTVFDTLINDTTATYEPTKDIFTNPIVSNVIQNLKNNL